MSCYTKVIDTGTSKEYVFRTMSEAAVWLKETTGKGTSPGTLSRCVKYNSLYQKRYRIKKVDVQEVKKEKYIRDDSHLPDRRKEKDGWAFWQGSLTPNVICMEKVLPFYDPDKFEVIRKRLKELDCVCYFDLTDDEHMAQKRTKCRLQIYRKFDTELFDEKVEKMLEMLKF